jgi:hypothetical protein
MGIAEFRGGNLSLEVEEFGRKLKLQVEQNMKSERF